MKKLMYTKGVLIALCAFSLVGCSKSSQDFTGDTTPSTNEGRNTNSSDIDSLVNKAIGNGVVTSFSETSAIIAPIKDDGQSVTQAAPNYTPTEGNITINYQSDCEFLFAISNPTTGQTSFISASLADIKKQTHLLVFGKIQDTGVVLANKVIIWRTRTGSED